MADVPHTPKTQPADVRETAFFAAGARIGNVEDLTRLYERSLPALYVWIHGRVTSGLGVNVEVDDLVQEVWLRAVAGVQRYDPQRSSFRTWLIGIAKNVLLETLRDASKPQHKQAFTSQTSDLAAIPDSVTTLTRAIARNEDVQHMREFIDKLDADERSLLLGHGIEGLPLAHVGQRLGLSEETAGKRWQRLIARLRQPAMWANVLAPARG